MRIDALDTAGSLHDRLAVVGAALMAARAGGLERGTVRETPQAAEGVTYAKKIRPKETRIDWTRPAAEVDRRIRGLSPFPGAWFVSPAERGPVRIKALLSRVEDGRGRAGRGAGRSPADRLRRGRGAHPARPARGRAAPRTPDDFLRGFPLSAGARLG